MREGYGSRFVCVCVYLSVTKFTATYLVYVSQASYQRLFMAFLRFVSCGSR